MEILEIEKTHNNILYSYPLLYNEFISKIKEFIYLEEDEFYNSENMSMKCLRKEIFDDEEYYTFLWNHYQRGEKHIIELTMNDGEYFIDITSKIYVDIIDYDEDKFIEFDSITLFKHYYSLYWANAWFSHFIKK